RPCSPGGYGRASKYLTAFGVSAMPRARDFLTLGRDWFATVTHFLVSACQVCWEVASAAGESLRVLEGPAGQPLPWSGHIRAAREWPTDRSRDSGWWWAARDTVRRCATLLEPIPPGSGSG